MFLKKVVFVNWGNVPNCEFEIGPVSLFSGANSSGKTTAADAIQTVMTAAHENLYHYNPGQDESTQRGRGKRVRTLASYVLGCDDGSYGAPSPPMGTSVRYSIRRSRRAPRSSRRWSGCAPGWIARASRRWRKKISRCS
jgi:uncharacterized protein YPO0396